MKIHRAAVLFAALVPLSLPAAGEPPATFAGATPLEWSQRLADSEMKRLGNSLEAGGSNPKARWDYSPGVFALGLVRLGEAVHREDYLRFGTRAVASHVNPDGTIRGYKAEDFNIDNIPPGKVLLAALARGEPNEAWTQAVRALRAQMAAHPRTSEGGFWHKQRYPHQMWLDGLYMASPFLAQYAGQFHEPALFDDVAKQIILMDRHAYDPATGLYWHAWDEAHAQSWADKRTGVSPQFWSRAIGWYAMAIVDSLDYLPVSQPEIDQIVGILRRVADGIVRWQDPATGVWWQITNQGGRPGNYLEGSGSAMFVYALAKGVNQGYLPREKYLPAILQGYAGLIRTLVKTGPGDAVSLTQICQGAGLGYTNSAGRVRDGSYEYYLSEPIVDNDPKGTGPFLLAGIEVQKLLAAAAAPAAPLRVTGWADYPAVLARIHAPVFPARDFPITDFGAQPGADATAALAAAIAACAQAGGGRVVVPAGDWLTGPIVLRSNVNLHLAKGAVLKFSTDPAAYPTVLTRWEGTECMNFSPLITAVGQENIAVTGEGTLDGQASDQNWWGWTKRGSRQDRPDSNALVQMGEAGVPVAQRIFGPGHHLRPNFIQPYRCKNILIEGVTIIRSPMWEINPELSENITVRGVTISSHGPNNDGCDPESCRDVLIEGCIFDTGDDCIAIKSGRNNDGRRIGVPAENHVVRGCTMKDGHGGVVIGSEISGGCRNIFVEDCVMDSPELDRALRLKSNARRGGVLENIFMRNVRIGRVAEAVLTIDLLYEEGAKGDFPPTIRNIRLEHITSEHSPRVLWIHGFPGATIDNIRISDSQFRGVETAEQVTGAGRIEFSNVTIEPAQKSPGRNSRPAEPPAQP